MLMSQAIADMTKGSTMMIFHLALRYVVRAEECKETMDGLTWELVVASSLDL